MKTVPLLLGTLVLIVLSTFNARVASAIDSDGDGWQVSDGDCCDSSGSCPFPALVNPGAFEVPGNSVDDDCNATTLDSDPLPNCSSGSVFFDVTGDDLARAMDLCQTTSENPPLSDWTWGVISAEFLLANGSAPSAIQLDNMTRAQSAVLEDYGTNVVPERGPTMVGLSSGMMRDDNDPGFVRPAPGSSLNSTSVPPPGYLAANGGSLPASAGCSGSCLSGSNANDSVNLSLAIRAPTNATSFSYKFKFTTAEYGTGVCTQYNDFHLALLDSGASGIPADKNIARDSSGNPVSVNNVSYEVCVPKGCHSCLLGISELLGTGMEINDTGGGTGWLTATAPVVPGETINLQLMVFDVSDHVNDTVVLIDAFEWHAASCGDGNVDTGEQCDDGNTVSGDGCSSGCMLESCGDSVLDPGEQCDDGNVLSGDGCSANCTIEICGNGILDTGEQCDDGNVLAGDGCSAICTLEDGGTTLNKEQQKALDKALEAQTKAGAEQAKACEKILEEIEGLIADAIAVPSELQGLFDGNCI